MGRGIGLALVAQAVHRLGGAIDVANEGGAVFSYSEALAIARDAVKDPQARLEPEGEDRTTPVGRRVSFARAVRTELDRRKRRLGILSYDDLLSHFSQSRGGPLYFPYLGSGIGRGALVELADGSVKLNLISGIGVGPAMWLYAAFNVAAWLFVYFRMPDLTGASLEEIERKLADGRFKPADFTRAAAAPSPR